MKSFLYRYESINKKCLDRLRRNQFHFTAPSKFNDPFDCKTLFSFDGSDDNDWRLFFDMQTEHQAPHLTSQERRNKIEQIIKTGKQRDLEARNAQLQIWRDILEQETNKLGIVCLSEKPDDILMWSHYSNKHRGYCLKFDKMVLERIFYCSSVDYRPVYPTFTDFVEELVQTGPNELHKAFLLTKSVHWEYEKEYRLMVDPSSREDLSGDRNYNYPEEALVAVICGCQMSERDKEEVKKVLRNRSYPISYLQAKKSESAYEIKIEPA